MHYFESLEYVQNYQKKNPRRNGQTFSLISQTTSFNIINCPDHRFGPLLAQRRQLRHETASYYFLRLKYFKGGKRTGQTKNN